MNIKINEIIFGSVIYIYHFYGTLKKTQYMYTVINPASAKQFWQILRICYKVFDRTSISGNAPDPDEVFDGGQILISNDPNQNTINQIMASFPDADHFNES